MVINGTVGKNGYTFYAVLTETLPNNYIETNQTLVSYEVYLKNGSTRTNTSNWTFNAKIDGSNVYYQTSQKLNTTDVGYNEAHLVFSGSKLITHNDDGTKTITFSSFLSKSSYGQYDPGYCELSGSFELTTIPRASTPTINTQTTNSPNFNIGNTITIYSNKKANFTHKLYFNYGNTSLYVGQFVDSIQFNTQNVANALYQLIPNSKSYTNTFKLETYNGSLLIGTSTCQYIANVVNSNPTFNVAYKDTNTTTTAVTQNNQQIIQNVSTLQINITNAEAKNYSSLSSAKVSINGIEQSVQISSSTLNINYGIVNVANNINAIVILTDSRGFATTINLPLTILSWQSPTAIITMNRKSNFYTETDIKVDANYSSLDSKNTIDIKYRIKKVSDSTWGGYTSLQDNITSSFNADNLYQWNVQVVVADKLGTTTYNLKLNVGQPILYVDRLNKNVGINCFAGSDNALEVQGNEQVNGNLYIADAAGQNRKEIRDLIYPIGSIYLSVNNVNPTNLFGGTWVVFGTGRTLVGVDTSQTEFNTVEKTGGEKTHTLTIDEMPSHNHDSNGWASVTDGSGDYNVFGAMSGGGTKEPTKNTGGGQPHNILQPYITVYMWKRTA